MRRTLSLLHGKLAYPVGTGHVAVGHELLPLLPSNDIFYDPPKLRARLDSDGYLYLKNIIPREVVNAGLDDLANQLVQCGWTTTQDRDYMAEKDGFAMGVPYPRACLPIVDGKPNADQKELPPPAIEYTDTIRQAVSGTSVMATVRQIFGGAVNVSTLQTLHLASPHEPLGFRMPSVFMNRGTKLALVALVPLHDTPLHMGAPVIVRSSNSTDSYAAIRRSYGQWEVESGDIAGDGCFTMQPEELLPIGKQQGLDPVTGRPIIVDVNPFSSCAFEAGDLLLMTVYTMHAFLTNQTNLWRFMGEAVWTMEGDDVGLDPRYVGDSAEGLGAWMAHREDPARYPKTMTQAKKEWGLIPDVEPPSDTKPAPSP